MASAEDKQMVNHLRQLSAVMLASHGAREFNPVIDRTTEETRDTGTCLTPHQYGHVILMVYALKPKDAPTEEKATTPKSTAKPSITVKVNGLLNEAGDTCLIASFTATKEGTHLIELPFLSSRYQVQVDVDGTAEYAVYAI
jgi:hypothetical protein